MVKMLMYAVVVIMCLAIIVVCVVGCGAPMTADNPYGVKDPNQVQEWFDLGVITGRGVQAAGAAIGNVYMIAYGGLLILVGGTAGQILFNKKKKEGEDSGTT